MKKLFICIFLIIVILNISAGDLFDFSWNMGNIGYGMYFSSGNDNNGVFNVSLLNLTFEHKNINMGFELSPVKYWQFFSFHEHQETKNTEELLSFINMNYYLDLIESSRIIFGPFVSVNYLIVNTLKGKNLNDYIFSGGVRFSYKTRDYQSFFYNYHSQIFHSEIGYRNILGRNSFYFSLNIDLIFVLMLIATGIQHDQNIN